MLQFCYSLSTAKYAIRAFLKKNNPETGVARKSGMVAKAKPVCRPTLEQRTLYFCIKTCLQESLSGLSVGHHCKQVCFYSHYIWPEQNLSPPLRRRFSARIFTVRYMPLSSCRVEPSGTVWALHIIWVLTWRRRWQIGKISSFSLDLAYFLCILDSLHEALMLGPPVILLGLRGSGLSVTLVLFHFCSSRSQFTGVQDFSLLCNVFTWLFMLLKPVFCERSSTVITRLQATYIFICSIKCTGLFI